MAGRTDLDSNELEVEFAGDERVLGPGESLSFGRQADIVVDDNPHLHRTVGRFDFADGNWWIHNVGRVIPLVLADMETRSKVVATAGVSVVVPFRESALTFEAGGLGYEIRLRSEGAGRTIDDAGRAAEEGGDTIILGSVALTESQRLALVALAEPALRYPHAPMEIPPNADVARRLGWTPTRLNRKIDNLCDKFSRMGVRGLRGSVDSLATDRRRRLVEYCIAGGVIEPQDLSLLPPV